MQNQKQLYNNESRSTTSVKLPAMFLIFLLQFCKYNHCSFVIKVSSFSISGNLFKLLAETLTYFITTNNIRYASNAWMMLWQQITETALVKISEFKQFYRITETRQQMNTHRAKSCDSTRSLIVAKYLEISFLCEDQKKILHQNLSKVWPEQNDGDLQETLKLWHDTVNFRN